MTMMAGRLLVLLLSKVTDSCSCELPSSSPRLCLSCESLLRENDRMPFSRMTLSSWTRMRQKRMEQAAQSKLALLRLQSAL